MAEREAEQFERHRRQQKCDLPIGCRTTNELPDAAVQRGHDERRKVPDLFLRAGFPNAAAREAAADGKGERDPLAGHRGRKAREGADRGAGVGSGDQSGDKGGLQREVGRVIAKEKPGDDARGHGDADSGREHQSVVPGAALEDQNVTEAPVTDEHRRQERDHGDLDHERGQQELFGREELGFLNHGLPWFHVRDRVEDQLVEYTGRF